MNPLLYALPFDPQGDSVNNRARAEAKDLNQQAGNPYRIIVMDKGHFYVEGLEVRESTGRLLDLHDDYQVTALNPEVVKLTGKEACALIVITNPKVKPKLLIDAQMVGGQFCQLSSAIEQMALGVLNSTRNVWYKNITGRPDRFPVNGHLHGIWDLYDFDEWVVPLQRIVTRILNKSKEAFAVLDRDVSAAYVDMNASLDYVHARFMAHLADTNNDHQVTKKQVGLEFLQNFPVATETQARALGETITTAYMTPLRTQQHMAGNWQVHLNAHLQARNNPHNVNYTQLGAYSISEANLMIGRLLDLHATAVGSYRLEGVLFPDMYRSARTNLDPGQVASYRFDLNRIGNGGRNRNYSLMGDNTWRDWPSMFAQFKRVSTKLVYMGGTWTSNAQALANVRVVYADLNAYPYGTIVVYRLLTEGRNGTGNGGTYVTNYYTVQSCGRVPGIGWSVA
jgi:hypothetical protein